MAVIIQNMTPHEDYGSGVQQYDLRINRIWKASFEHNFEDGLATCLRKAADAFEQEENSGHRGTKDNS